MAQDQKVIKSGEFSKVNMSEIRQFLSALHDRLILNSFSTELETF